MEILGSKLPDIGGEADAGEETLDSLGPCQSWNRKECPSSARGIGTSTAQIRVLVLLFPRWKQNITFLERLSPLHSFPDGYDERSGSSDLGPALSGGRDIQLRR